MVWPNLALVLPLSLPLPSSRAFSSSCIINKPLISDCYKLGKLHKCWRFRASCHSLPFVAAVDHSLLQKKSSPFSHVHTRDIYSKSRCHVSEILCKRLPYCCAYCGGRLHTSATFRIIRNLTDVHTMTVVRLWYRNKLLTATVHVLISHYWASVSEHTSGFNAGFSLYNVVSSFIVRHL